MREKLKIKKDKDFVKALNLNEKDIKEVSENIQKLEGIPLSELIKKLWESDYSNNKVIWSIFELGQAKARQDLANQATKMLGNIGGLLK